MYLVTWKKTDFCYSEVPLYPFVNRKWALEEHANTAVWPAGKASGCLLQFHLSYRFPPVFPGVNHCTFAILHCEYRVSSGKFPYFMGHCEEFSASTSQQTPLHRNMHLCRSGFFLSKARGHGVISGILPGQQSHTNVNSSQDARLWWAAQGVHCTTQADTSLWGTQWVLMPCPLKQQRCLCSLLPPLPNFFFFASVRKEGTT